MINFLEIKDNLKYKDFAQNLYNEAFPIEERWDFDAILNNNNNKFYAILDGDIPVGITTIWEFLDFNYIEYLAIDKKFRGKNYGSKIYDFYGIPPTGSENHPMHGLYLFKTGFGGREVHRPGSVDIPLSKVYGLYCLAENLRAFYHKKIMKKIRGR